MKQHKAKPLSIGGGTWNYDLSKLRLLKTTRSSVTVQIPAGVTSIICMRETSRVKGSAGRGFILSGNIIIEQKLIQSFSSLVTTSSDRVTDGSIHLITLNGEAGNLSITLDVVNPNSDGICYLFYIDNQ